MTVKLYYKDSHMQMFKARVLACDFDENKGCYAVELDQTAFFPEGGGQYADMGMLGGVQVEDVREKQNVILHYLKRPLQTGSEVEGKIDFQERFSRMQQHSGEHIVSGIVHKHFGYENVGFHLGEFVTTLDFNGPLSVDEVARVEYEANQAVVSNIEIQEAYPTKEELASMEYRSKKELEGQVRIVIIPGYDVCACCAPHVRRTGEIGMIKLIDAVKYKGGTRVSMVAGFRALMDYREKEANVKEISRALSAKANEVADAVRHLQAEAAQWKERAGSMQMRYLEGKLEEITEGTENYFLFEAEMDKNVVRRFVDAGMRKASGICGIFLGDDGKGYQYTMGSLRLNMRDYLKGFHAACPGKGGGKPEMVQGTVKAAKAEIEAFLAS